MTYVFIQPHHLDVPDLDVPDFDIPGFDVPDSDIPDFVASFPAVTATKAKFGVRISKQFPPGRTIT